MIKKLQILSVNCVVNLLSLINPSLVNVYCSIILLNHYAIRLRRFVLQLHVTVQLFFLIFNISCMCSNIYVMFLFKNF